MKDVPSCLKYPDYKLDELERESFSDKGVLE